MLAFDEDAVLVAVETNLATGGAVEGDGVAFIGTARLAGLVGAGARVGEMLRLPVARLGLGTQRRGRGRGRGRIPLAKGDSMKGWGSDGGGGKGSRARPWEGGREEGVLERTLAR